MKGSLIFVLLVCFVCTIAVPVEKIKSRARQNNKELKDLQKRVSKLKEAVIHLKTERDGVSQASNDELEKEEEMLERGGKTKETNSNPEKEEQPTGPVVFTAPVKLSETNIEDAVEKVAKTVRMLEKMLEHEKHAVTQHGHTEEELKDIRAKQTAATRKPNTEAKTLLTRGTVEPTRKPPKESTMNGESTTVSTEAVIKTSAINELKDDLEITVEKLTSEPATESEPETKTTRTLEPDVRTSNAQKKKAAGRSQEDKKITIEKIIPTTRKPNTEAKTLLTRGTAEPTRKPPKESTMNGESTTVSTEAVIKTSAINELKDDLEITVEKLTSEPAREPEAETKTTRTLEPEVKTSNAQKKKAAGRSQEDKKITIEKITPNNEPEAHIISVERIYPGRSTAPVTGDDKKTAEKLAQQGNDEELELAGKQPHKNKRTQERTEASAEHAQSSQPTRQQAVIEPTPTPDKMAINREEEKLEHELEKEKLPKRLHPPTQVSSGTDRLVLVNGKSTIIIKAPMTTAKQPTETLKQTVRTVKPTTEEEKKVTERTLFSSKIRQTKGEHIPDELQEELTNKHSLKIKTRKPGLHHSDETTTRESSRRPTHNMEELEEELERQLDEKTKMARVRKSQVDKNLEEDLREIALH